MTNGKAEKRPFRIAGAGLSGLSAAITLARAGRPVEVHERGKGPGSRHHLDLQGIENWSQPVDVRERLADIGLDLDCPLYPVDEVHLMGTHLKEVVVRERRPLFYLVRRGLAPGTLDDFMKRKAESLGVPIHCHSPLDRTQADIWATGPPRATGVVSGYTFRSQAPSMSVCALHEEYAPGGYAFLNIAGGYGTLGSVLLHSLRNARRCAIQCRELMSSRFDFDMGEVRSFGGLGYFGLPRRGTAPILEVGEAGGFQDLFFGFGIYLALLTGHLAARCLLDGRSFDALRRDQVDPFLRASLSNRFLFEIGGSFGRRYLIQQAQKNGAGAFLERWYRLGPAKKALYQVARVWARLRF